MMGINLLFSVCFATGCIHSGEIKIFKKNSTPFIILALEGDLLYQSSPLSVVMCIKATSINLPNFIPFWKPLNEISAAKFCRFHWGR